MPRERTHWEGCWRERTHHECALVRIKALEIKVEAREKRVAELEAALADERWRREAAEVKTSPKDSARMLWLVRDSGVDQIGEIDLHAEASIYAQIFGRAEANDDDYIAAIRTAIDSARYGKD